MISSDGHAGLALQVGEQVEDLPRSVTSSAVVGSSASSSLRPARQRHGDHGALPLAARQLVRKGAARARRLGDAGGGQRLDGRSRPAAATGPASAAAPRRSGRRPCTADSAPSSAPGRSSRSRGRGYPAARARSAQQVAHAPLQPATGLVRAVTRRAPYSCPAEPRSRLRTLSTVFAAEARGRPTKGAAFSPVAESKVDADARPPAAERDTRRLRARPAAVSRHLLSAFARDPAHPAARRP